LKKEDVKIKEEEEDMGEDTGEGPLFSIFFYLVFVRKREKKGIEFSSESKN